MNVIIYPVRRGRHLLWRVICACGREHEQLYYKWTEIPDSCRACEEKTLLREKKGA